jgi:hypothetical protein
MRPAHRTLTAIGLALSLGAALRLWFLWHFPQINGDGLVYGDIAKNWLHGTYGRTDYGLHGVTVNPTLIRLPGYPLFLAACFRIFGIDHYGAVLYLQVAIDLASALLVAWTAGAVAGRRAGMLALFLAALCPFTANYVAAPLSETLSIFCIALGCATLVWIERRPDWPAAMMLAATWSYATLLRPDGALLAISGFISLGLFAGRGGQKLQRREPALGRDHRRRVVRLALAAGLLSLLPFVAWTVRNLRTFHVFQPLASRYATDPGESTAPGFQRWIKTWAADFASTSDVYWSVDNAPLDLNTLPERAFDSPAQRAETGALFNDYNQDTTVTPALDTRFAELARERECAHSLRSFVIMPTLRVLDMWLRPRTEMLNIELRWWQYGRHEAETLFATAYAALNLAYLVLAAVGGWQLRRTHPVLVSSILIYCLLRSALLATIEAPEARYTVEAFPMLCVLAAAACVHRPESGQADRPLCPPITS